MKKLQKMPVSDIQNICKLLIPIKICSIWSHKCLYFSHSGHEMNPEVWIGGLYTLSRIFDVKSGGMNIEVTRNKQIINDGLMEDKTSKIKVLIYKRTETVLGRKVYTTITEW